MIEMSHEIINSKAANNNVNSNGILRLNDIGRKPSMNGIPRAEDKNENIVKERMKELSNSYLDILYAVGEDPLRQGLRKTPERAAKALLHFTKGYEETISGLFKFEKILFNFYITRFTL